MQLEILNEKHEKQYENFLLNNSLTLFYSSNKYRKLLRRFLHEEDYYIIALNKWDEIIGALPTFLKRNEKLGNVLNSLPFYGSNGSIIEYAQNEKVKKELLGAFFGLAKDHNCLSATLITSPLEPNKTFYENNFGHTFFDKRIGQLTPLPKNNSDVADMLMKLFHQKTRNMVRKAQKYRFQITSEYTEIFFKFLCETHIRNINTIGGLAKPIRFFELIPEIFKYDKEYKIYVALQDETPVAALLVFYFNKTVEYFTPVIDQRYRALQPLSLLIFYAMQEAVRRGFEWWNWGGTWLTQTSVHRFKKRWGTVDKPYFYYTKLYDKKIIHHSKEELIQDYPYFYVLPFEQLSQREDNDQL
ncbi:MAG: peptidoglycan bridge formation glycyltransferase FemA/FemB family protein [Deltaproteobacteria bacterium]|nr:peptidoglycan bridge formation glycyltransferase FemA/FemB family protein [Deltaproteobacteria bacterium]MBW2301384.1 peptidoglycan bridge formation glycyltransferase FemA/FemB family protein [Deltaproteobacteria bacterium]